MVFNNANNNKCFHKLISNDKKSADIHWNEIELLLNQLKSIFDEIESLKREQWQKMNSNTTINDEENVDFPFEISLIYNVLVIAIYTPQSRSLTPQTKCFFFFCDVIHTRALLILDWNDKYLGENF